MPRDVWSGYETCCNNDASLIQKYATQNVPSGAMAKQSTSIAAHSTGRMILVALLVVGYCFTSCLGVPHRPAVFSRSLDYKADSLERNIKLSKHAVNYDWFAPSDILYMGENPGPDSGVDDKGRKFGRKIKKRKPKLRKILENLTKLRYHQHLERSPEIESEVTREVEDNTKASGIVSKTGANTKYQQTYYHLQPGLPLKQHSETLHLRPLQVVAHVDMVVSSDGHDNTDETDIEQQKREQFNDNHFFSILDEPVTSETEVSGYLPGDACVNCEPNEQKIEDMGTQTKQSGFKRLYRDLDNSQYSLGYFKIPANYESSDFHSNTLGRKYVQYGDRQEDDDSSSSEETNFTDIPHENVVITTGIDSVVRDIHSSNSMGEGADHHSKAVSVEALIHKTVKQMEGIINKRIAHYNGIYDAESIPDINDVSSQTLAEKSAKVGFKNDGLGYIAPQTGEQDINSSDVNKNNGEEIGVQDEADEQFPQLQHQHVNDVISAVSKAVASRTVPRDPQFWRNVSSYLDSSDYLSRTRRSTERKRKRTQFVHLSITYGHVMPCEHKDRFFCMNGGTCVFVGALDIKTCR